MDLEDIFTFGAKCLGAALIFRGVDAVFDARQRRKAQEALMQYEQQRNQYIEDLKAEVERLKKN